MTRIRRANTKPELVIRRLLHSLGYHFRVQFGEVPGRPDIVFPARRRCVQVHGCFWHAHGCSLSQTSSTRTEFWEAKFARNRERDERLERHASALGWDTLTIWECVTSDIAGLTRRLTYFLGPPQSS